MTKNEEREVQRKLRVLHLAELSVVRTFGTDGWIN
jgi:hypothetical protein